MDTMIKLNGRVVYWDLSGQSNYGLLKSGLTHIGVPELIPERCTEISAVRIALRKNVRRIHEHLSSTLQGKGLGVSDIRFDELKEGPSGYSITSIRSSKTVEGKSSLEYPVTHTAVLSTGINIRGETFKYIKFNTLKGDDLPEPLRRQILDDFYAAIETVPSQKLSRTLVRLIGKCQGISLREHGSIYWIPDTHSRLWEQTKIVVEQSSAANTVYGFRTLIDADATRALTDALRSNILKELNKIDDSLRKGFKQEGALERRREQADLLREKVQEYQLIIGEVNDELLERVESTRRSAAIAGLASLS